MARGSKPAFFEAIRTGDIRAVRMMLGESPSLIKARSEYGFTPLMSAVSSMDRTLKTIQILIDAGANVGAKTKEGLTALHLMIDVNGPTGTGKMPGRIARLLVNAGAKIEVRQQWGWTPLMKAALEGTADELQAIVRVGGSVNETFPSNTMPAFMRGRTTLMATIGEPTKTQILIKAGVDLTAKDAHGETALDYARSCLAEAGAQAISSSEIVQQILDAAQTETLRHMRKLGIDPKVSLDGTGTTLKDAVENSLGDGIAKLNDTDYAAEVRTSIAMIENAQAGR